MRLLRRLSSFLRTQDSGIDSAVVLSPATSTHSEEDLKVEVQQEVDEQSMDELDHDNTSVSFNDGPQAKRRRTDPPRCSLPARAARTRDATTPPWLKDTRRSTRQKAADQKKMGKSRSRYAESPSSPSPPKVAKGPSARAKVRSEIVARNKPKRDAFLLHHRELFEPLLPASNYISKLSESSAKEIARHVPVKQQPEG